jgi:hydrogenase expression/formation protein HypE
VQARLSHEGVDVGQGFGHCEAGNGDAQDGDFFRVACEMLGLDPLYVANEGLFMAIVDAAIADSVLGLMQQDEKGIDAAIIGEVTTDHPGQVVMTSRIGGRRVVNYLAGEQLPRIC